MGKKGTFVLSLDCELAWGVYDLKNFEELKTYLNKRDEIYNKLLALLEKYEITATWAFVGHLFLDSCEKDEYGNSHPEIKKVEKNESWHNYDPCSNIQEEPLWYGKDLVEKVFNSKIKHDIGSHSFSHIFTEEATSSEEIFSSEIKACKSLANNMNIDMKSFIFPRNQVNYLSILAENEFCAYRGRDEYWYSQGNLNESFKKAMHFSDRLLAFEPPTYSLEKLSINSGVVNIPGSMYFMPPIGIRKFIPGKSRVLQAEKGIKKAIKNNEIFHLWFHPWELGVSEKTYEWLEEILIEVSKQRDINKLEIKNMAEIGKERLKIGELS